MSDTKATPAAALVEARDLAERITTLLGELGTLSGEMYLDLLLVNASVARAKYHARVEAAAADLMRVAEDGERIKQQNTMGAQA